MQRTAFAGDAGPAAERTRPLQDAVNVSPGATCLETAKLIEHVRAWLGDDKTDADVSVEVRGSPDDPRVVRFRTLRAGRVVASRGFEPGPEQCDHLHAALGLAIAMALKASLIDELAGLAAAAKPAHGPQEAKPGAWALGASALGAMGVLPGLGFGADVRFERAFASTITVRFGAIGFAALGGTFPGVSGTFDAWVVAPRADFCAALDTWPSLSIRGCMGLAAGALLAQGHAFANSDTSFVRWVAAMNSLDAVLDLGDPWSLDLDVSLVLPLVSASIALKGAAPPQDVVAERNIAAVGGFVGLGPVYRF
jgi:hypothetical protein